MVVQHNMSALNASRMYGLTSNTQSKITEKLSSGYKINRAADDAAGLAISEKLRYQIRGLNQGSENIQEGISACQIMDGSLNEVQDILLRMTELSVKAANGTLDASDRNAIEQEMRQLRSEISRTTENSTFNEKQLLSAVDIVDGTGSVTGGKADIVFLLDNTGSMDTHLANVKNNLATFADSLSNCNVQYGVISYGDIADGATAITNYGFFTSASATKTTIENMRRSGGGDEAESALEGIEEAISLLNSSGRSDAVKQIILVTDAQYHHSGDGSSSILDKDTVTNDLNNAGITLSSVIKTSKKSYYDGLSNGKILDITSNFHDSLMTLASDIAESAGEVIHKNPENIRIQCSGEPSDFIMLRTYNVNSDTLGLIDPFCDNVDNAEKTINLVKEAGRIVSEIRTQIGADQNRLEHAYNNNQNVAENTTASESQIRDTDMAKEMVEYSNNNILSQAGASMLASANQSREMVLSLLS